MQLTGQLTRRMAPATALDKRAALARVPFAAALAVVCLTIAVPRDTLFAIGIPVGPGSLKVTDLLLAVAMGGWLAGHRGRLRTGPPSRATLAALAAFLAVAAAGLVTAAVRGNPADLALLEFRPLLAYLLVIPLAAHGGRAAVRFALAAVAATAAAASLVIIGLYAAGEGNAAQFADGATRVETMPFTASLIGVTGGLALLPHARARREQLIGIGVAAVSAVALYFTLQRGAWLGAIAGAAVGVAMAPPSRRLRLVVALAGAAVIAGTGVTVINAVARPDAPNPISAGADRLGSVFSPGDDISSQHRFAEWREARGQVERHPVTGIGLGGSITFDSPLYDPETARMGRVETNIYIHNSYIWAATKMGVLGVLALIALLGVPAVRGAAAVRGTRGPPRALLSAALAVIAALAVTSLTGPHLTTDSSTALLAGAIACIEVVRRRVAERP